MKIENLYKSYGENVVYSDFNLEIEENKVTCILGESGSGKTTLLNIIANLIDFKGTVPKLKCACVFQSPRLVPNLTVLKNLKLICSDENKIKTALEEAGIGDKMYSYPAQLSGGQAQRVAIVRAFLHEADTMLLDEPFSSLDLKLKIRLMDAFLSRVRNEKKTVLFVTHDVDEAVYFSDRIIVLQGGKIIFDTPCGTSREEYGGNADLRRKLISVITQE